MPFTKCSIKEDPAKLTTIDEITLKKEDFVKVYTNWYDVTTYSDVIATDDYGAEIYTYNDETGEYEPEYESTTTREAESVDFDYECVNPFNRTASLPPDAIDVRCNPDDYDETVSPNSAGATGDPYNSDFFSYSSTNGLFTKRHKTLFNLYAFDSTRTLKTKPP